MRLEIVYREKSSRPSAATFVFTVDFFPGRGAMGMNPPESPELVICDLTRWRGGTILDLIVFGDDLVNTLSAKAYDTLYEHLLETAELVYYEWLDRELNTEDATDIDFVVVEGL